MDKRTEFNEALAALMEYATVNGDIVTQKDVHNFFKDILEDDSLYNAVYEYLTTNKIKIEDYTPVLSPASTISYDKSNETSDLDSANLSDIKETEEGQMFLDMYFDELKNLPTLSYEELVCKTQAIINGDTSHINIVLESFLSKITDIASTYTNQGVKQSDLISEGNLGLLTALSTLPNSNKKITNPLDYFENIIKEAIENAITVETGSLRTQSHITHNVNAVSDAATYLAEKYGREATLKEICDYVSLPEETVKEIMKMSLDAINKE